MFFPAFAAHDSRMALQLMRLKYGSGTRLRQYHSESSNDANRRKS